MSESDVYIEMKYKLGSMKHAKINMSMSIYYENRYNKTFIVTIKFIIHLLEL